MRDLKLKTTQEWDKYCGGKMPEKGEKPKDIPTNPNFVYAKEWTHWGDWLGTGRKPGHKGMLGVKQMRNALPFFEAREPQKDGHQGIPLRCRRFRPSFAQENRT